MLNNTQMRSLLSLAQDPAAKIHPSTRKVLVSRGMLDANGLTISGFHQLGVTRHHPEIRVPTPEEWAHLKGKSVEVTEWREKGVAADIYGDREVLNLSIDKIMPLYTEYAMAMNKLIKCIWTVNMDREYAHNLRYNHVAYVNPKWALQQAKSKVDMDILGRYTGDITCRLVDLLLEGKKSGDLGGHSHKYSYSDTDDEVDKIAADPKAEIAAHFQYDVWL